MQATLKCLGLLSLIGFNLIAVSDTAQAKPSFASACNGCHFNPGGDLDILPSDLLEVEAGETAQLTFSITDNPGEEGALSLSGINTAVFGATVGTGWTSQAGGAWYTTKDFEGTKSVSLALTIDPSVLTGDYIIPVIFAGGEPEPPEEIQWSTTRFFTVRVSNQSIPEPASLALAMVGIIAIGSSRLLSYKQAV